MLSLANRTRGSASRMQRTYRIEMGGRTLLISLGLACLTGLVLFYMGVVTGKGARTVEGPPMVQAPGDGGEALPEVGEESLAFNQALMGDERVVEDLWESQAETSRQTEALIERANRELTVEEVPLPTPQAPRVDSAPAPAAAAPEQPAPPRPAAAAPPAAPARRAAAPADGGYTVQVASSQNRESAAALVQKLKGLGFDAYLNQFQDSGRKIWYRVRVGRTSREDAERLRSSLQRRANVQSSQIIQM